MGYHYLKLKRFDKIKKRLPPVRTTATLLCTFVDSTLLLIELSSNFSIFLPVIFPEELSLLLVLLLTEVA